MIIYKATNQINNKIYIGKTTQDLKKRKYAHKYNATRGEHCRGYKSAFYNAIRKYGFDKFKWEVIDCAESIDELNRKEKFYIKSLNSIKKGYNISEGGSGGDNFTNHPDKENIRKKISESLKGRKMSPEFCKQNRERQVGRKFSKETIEKRRKALKGRKLTAEWKKKISESLKGKKRPPEVVEKTAKALRGRKHSEEMKQKLSESRTGRKHSQETKDKISAKMKGRVIDPEWRDKIRQGNLKAQERKSKITQKNKI